MLSLGSEAKEHWGDAGTIGIAAVRNLCIHYHILSNASTKITFGWKFSTTVMFSLQVTIANFNILISPPCTI